MTHKLILSGLLFCISLFSLSAQNRAEAVAKALKAQGLPESVKILVQSFGLSKPIAPNTTEAGRAQNRRVDVVMEW